MDTSELEWSICKPKVPMHAVVTALLIFCLCGCGIIMIGEPVKPQDPNSVNDAEENLKAIRTMLSDRASRRSEDINSSPQPSFPDAGLPPVEPSSAVSLTPSSSSRRADVPAKLPWTPTPPDRPSAPDRVVPAYTVPAPVGPDYSGAVRCAPDGMGGQRCLGR